MKKSRKTLCSYCGKNDFADFRPSTISRHEVVCALNPLLESSLRRPLKRVTRLRVRVVSVADEACNTKRQYRNVPETFDAADFPLITGLPENFFSVLLLDPPFSYGRSVGKGVAENHYRTMTDDELSKLPLARISTQDALLFLWCSGPTLDRAIHLLDRWGFTYKTVGFVWVKTNKAGNPQSMGLGTYTRPGVEMVLIATRGKPAHMIFRRIDQVVYCKRTRHSEKPASFRRLIDNMTGKDPRIKKIELFSRKGSDSEWSAWGDQVCDDER